MQIALPTGDVDAAFLDEYDMYLESTVACSPGRQTEHTRSVLLEFRYYRRLYERRLEDERPLD